MGSDMSGLAVKNGKKISQAQYRLPLTQSHKVSIKVMCHDFFQGIFYCLFSFLNDFTVGVWFRSSLLTKVSHEMIRKQMI